MTNNVINVNFEKDEYELSAQEKLHLMCAVQNHHEILLKDRRGVVKPWKEWLKLHQESKKHCNYDTIDLLHSLKIV